MATPTAFDCLVVVVAVVVDMDCRHSFGLELHCIVADNLVVEGFVVVVVVEFAVVGFVVVESVAEEFVVEVVWVVERRKVVELSAGID